MKFNQINQLYFQIDLLIIQISIYTNSELKTMQLNKMK
uniref:Uncharacterized protein n=1 Tax=Rhizophora mucronata TaxID=61149 RepID=A0A2P2P1G8_RHIMU